jgi:hypothetical protein
MTNDVTFALSQAERVLKVFSTTPFSEDGVTISLTFTEAMQCLAAYRSVQYALSKGYVRGDHPPKSNGKGGKPSGG